MKIFSLPSFEWCSSLNISWPHKSKISLPSFSRCTQQDVSSGNVGIFWDTSLNESQLLPTFLFLFQTPELTSDGVARAEKQDKKNWSFLITLWHKAYPGLSVYIWLICETEINFNLLYTSVFWGIFVASRLMCFLIHLITLSTILPL